MAHARQGFGFLVGAFLLEGGCFAKTADVTSSPSPASDAAVDGHASSDLEPIVDGGTTSEASVLPLGLVVDGVACTSTVGGTGAPWPNWQLTIEGDCGALGTVRGVVGSSASIPYPQECGIATSVSWGMDGEGDAGTLYYVATLGKGSCTIESGPSDKEPNAPLVFHATLIHAFNPSLHHVISYRR